MHRRESVVNGKGATRRNFIKNAATMGVAAAMSSSLNHSLYGQANAPAIGRVLGANDRINVAVVGLGVRCGQNHLLGITQHSEANNVRVVAACDLFTKRRAWAKERGNLRESDIYSDYRKLLEDRDIDAVVCSTNDIWHARIACDAMQAGKHVYCEKPMTRYLGEAFKVYDTVRKTGKVFQIGSQSCSAEAWHVAADMINGGRIGTLVSAQGYYCRNNPNGEWNDQLDPDSTAKNIDWEMWLGEVKNRIPFSAEHFHRWRKYYPYSAGLMADLGSHRVHPLMLASGNPEFPKRVVSIGTTNVHTDRTLPGTPVRDGPEQVQLVAEFPSGYMITVTCSTVNARSPGFAIYGHKATLNVSDQGNAIELIPERPFVGNINADKIGGLRPEDMRVHEKNWFDCIRSNKQPSAGIELAIRAQTVICLGEMSDRLGIACFFDEKKRRVTDVNGTEIPAITYGTLPLS